MNQEEWREKEAYYERKVKEIIIPMDIDVSSLKRLISEIDALLTEAVFDYTRAKNAKEQLTRQAKTYQKQYFLYYKREQKMSDKACDAAATSSANKEGILEQEAIAIERYNFMETVVGILRDKREMLITENGVLKLEAGL